MTTTREYRGRTTILPLLVMLLAGHARLTVAQGTETLLAEGMSAERHDPATALKRFDTVLAADPGNYEALWRGARALVDIGKQTPDTTKSAARDSLYALAEAYARRAVAADSLGADGHYILAAAIGRASLTKSKKERVRRAAEIRAEALRALELNPEHDAAYHVLGRWNAEIMRLSGLTRFFAKTFLGGAIFNQASWDGAVNNMERAVAYNPAVIYHHLDLAEILVDLGRYTEAREQLRQVAELPVFDIMDPVYQADGAALLKRIEGRKDKS
jgi:tetratricopeptide (TPR) repeat protein